MFATTQQIKTTRAELTTSITPLENEANCLTISTEAEYQFADGVLTKLAEAERRVEDKLNPPIKKIYDALEEMYALRRDILNPLKQATAAVKQRMKAYKDAERQKLLAEQRKRQEEESRLMREADEKALAEQSAVTAAMKMRLATKRIELEQRAVEVASAPLTAPVRASGSTTKLVKKVCVSDYLALLKGAAERKVDMQVFELNQSYLNAAYRKNPAEVSQWPGIEIKEETEIVRR